MVPLAPMKSSPVVAPVGRRRRPERTRPLVPFEATVQSGGPGGGASWPASVVGVLPSLPWPASPPVAPPPVPHAPARRMLARPGPARRRILIAARCSGRKAQVKTSPLGDEVKRSREAVGKAERAAARVDDLLALVPGARVLRVQEVAPRHAREDEPPEDAGEDV